MNIRPIRSDDDYQSAMDRIESLMDVEDPTLDQLDEIELLSWSSKTMSASPFRSIRPIPSRRSSSEWIRRGSLPPT